jgi:hypothetical protein
MPVYALREPFHPSGQSLRIVVHPEQSVRLRCQVHACDRGDGIRLPVVRVEIAFHVLREGVEKGVFLVDDIDMTAELVHYSVKGIEVPYIRGHIGAKLTDETRGQYVENIVFGALRRKE